MLGVKIAPEQVAMIEAIIPQIPSHVQGAVALINGAVKNFDQRLQALERGQKEILEALNYGRPDSGGGDTLSAGIGVTQQRYDGTNGADTLDG